MAEHTPEAVAEALDWYHSMFEARTYAQGVEFSHDEVLVAEIDRLTALLQPTGDDRERAREIYRAGKNDPHPIGLIAEALAADRAGERAGYDALVTALEPFAACADFIDSHIREISDDTGLWTPSSSDGSAPSIKASHVRQARAALAQVKP